jgi:hypothetical protein
VQPIKLKVALKVGVPYYLIDQTAPPATAWKWVKLLSFVASNGRLEWDMVTSGNHRITGTLRGKQRLPFWPEAWICPSIPFTLHDKQADGLAPDFIFSVPSHYKIDYRGR